MSRPRRLLRAALLAALLTAGCSGDPESPADTADTADTTPDTGAEPDGVEAPACDDTITPIVMVHGFLASGDTWAPHTMRWASLGWCVERIRAFDWNTLQEVGDGVPLLDAFVDATLEATGAQQVHLIGHSRGGSLGYAYLEDPARAAKVERYVHVGSGHEDGPPAGQVPALNLWSEGDLVITEKGDIEGVENRKLTDEDHYAVATSDASFVAIHTFLTGEAPSSTAILAEAAPSLSGKALTFGENAPLAGGTVTVWTIDLDTAQRLEDAPAAVFDIADDGGWGPFEIDPQARYEYVIRSADSQARPVHYHLEPARRSNPLVYLRTLPGPGSTAGALLAAIPFGPDNSVVVIFSSRQAIVAGRDALSVDGHDLATEDFASPDQTLLALFLYDTDEDGETSAAKAGLFDGFPFLNGADIFFDATREAPVEVIFNDRIVRARPWAASTEGAVVIVLD